MPILDDVTQAVGNTPLVRINRIIELGDSGTTVAAKLEFYSPASSVKDRIGVAIIDAAEASGELPAGGTEIDSVGFNFAGNTVVWEWDQAEGLWLRSASGSESNYRDEDGTLGRVGLPVMVAINAEQYTASPPAGGRGLPSSRAIGSGTAYVFADGQVIEGTWEREAETDWFTITDASGEVIPIPPGKIWISVIPGSGGVTLTPAE